MKAFVLTAGLGRRLQPITHKWPKPSLPLLNIPIVYYAMTPLLKAEVQEFVCNLHHLSDQMVQTLKGISPSIHFIEEKPHLLGAAGGIQNAKKYFKDEEDFFVVNGDTVFLPDHPEFLKTAYEKHKQHNALATLVLIPYKGFSDYSAVWFHKKTNQIISFSPTPQKNMCLAGHFIGYYLLSSCIFKYLKLAQMQTHIFQDVLSMAIQKGDNVLCVYENGYWFEVGNKVDFLKTTKALLNLRQNNAYLKAIMSEYLKPQIDHHLPYIDDVQTVLLGNKLKIGNGVKISGHSVIGDNVILGSGVAVHNSVILSGCQVKDGLLIHNDIVFH